MLLRGTFGLLQFLLLGVEGVLGLVGVVYVGEGLKQGLVVLQQGGLQAGIGGLNVSADAAGGEEGELYADAEEAAVAAAGAVEGGEVAVELDAAGLPEELDVEAGEEVGFGAGELGAAGLDFSGAGAQVGALVEKAAGPDALWRAGQVLQQGGTVGSVIGHDAGAAKTLDEAGLLEITAQKLDDGSTAVILLAQENSEAPLDQFFGRFQTTVARWDAAAVQQELAAAVETQAELARQAHEAWEKQKTDEFKGKVEQFKTDIKQEFDKLASKLHLK